MPGAIGSLTSVLITLTLAAYAQLDPHHSHQGRGTMWHASERVEFAVLTGGPNRSHRTSGPGDP